MHGVTALLSSPGAFAVSLVSVDRVGLQLLFTMKPEALILLGTFWFAVLLRRR
jgi:hypothetical protein